MDAPQRKRRFAVSWPLTYRRADTPRWHRGRTVNMSVSGVLFEAPEVVPADEVVELSILFQSPLGQHAPAIVINTSGHVVRTEPKLPARIAVKFAALP